MKTLTVHQWSLGKYPFHKCMSWVFVGNYKVEDDGSLELSPRDYRMVTERIRLICATDNLKGCKLTVYRPHGYKSTYFDRKGRETTLQAIRGH